MHHEKFLKGRQKPTVRENVAAHIKIDICKPLIAVLLNRIYTGNLPAKKTKKTAYHLYSELLHHLGTSEAAYVESVVVAALQVPLPELHVGT